jgi:antitoxin (DNA-binding transcriptional repressor) of toxin-antitoxin stability system
VGISVAVLFGIPPYSGYVGHMKQAKISDLKNNLSRYIAYVRKGGVVRVLDRERPVADLVPLTRAEQGTGEIDAILADLERKGVVSRGTGVLPKGFFDRPLPKGAASVVAALLDERRDGR